MKILAKVSLGALACLAMLPLTSSAPADNHKGKITICHVPPGNPANRHMITVSVNALDAHLAHGDFIGSCNPTPPPPPEPEPAPTEPVEDTSTDWGWDSVGM